jgi:hypothetical protein
MQESYRVRVYQDNLQLDLLEEYYKEYPMSVDAVIEQATVKYSNWEIITVDGLFIRRLRITV